MTFADGVLARERLAAMYPNAQHVRLVETGDDNIVGLVDHTYAVRFPRNANSYRRSLYEREVLQSLRGIHSIKIPQVVSVADDPPCLTTSFIAGEHLCPEAIRQWSRQEQEALGQQVARFAYEMHQALPIAEVWTLREQLKLDELDDEPWDIYLEKMLMERAFPTPMQDVLAKRYFALWRQQEGHGEAVIIHDDLHADNMLIGDNQLVGVLDFGDTSIGTPEQELRQLYRINEATLLAAVSTYEALSGKQLSVEASTAWAITQELAAYSKQLASGKTTHLKFARACRNLNAWLPEGAWGEGLIRTDPTGSQQ